MSDESVQMPIEIYYGRDGAKEGSPSLVRFRTRGLTNHELRAVLIGMWLMFQPADALDFIRELENVSRGGLPPKLSLEIASGKGRLS